MIGAGFPGGNIVLEKVEGDEVFLRQDLRDTEGWWFYWCFRVRGAAGRTLRFRFTNKDVMTALGPAVSVDRGKSWRWLGRDTVEDASFQYSFPEDAEEVRFGLAVPYLEANLAEFIGLYSGSPHLKVETLCETRKGRRAERLHVGRLDGKCEHRVLLTCRHHACEMMANYALEGIMETVLGETEDGQWLREHVEFLVIPFVDKDGVEDGDQGKNRRPRDHNRNYEGESVHVECAAMREFVPEWSERRVAFALDMHCPYVRGKRDETVFFVGMEDQRQCERLGEFSHLLEAAQTGAITFSAENNLPFGVDWNTQDNYSGGRSCSRWARETLEGELAVTIEIPYASASGEAVTAESARELGRDLARAMRRFLD